MIGFNNIQVELKIKYCHFCKMKNSVLFLLAKSFSPIELREVRKFLASPFFNQREDLILLFEYVLKTDTPQKEQAWEAMYPSPIPYSEKNMRLLMSYLHRLLEQYLAIKFSTKNELDNRLNLTLAYQERGMNEAFEKSVKRLEKNIGKQSLRNSHIHEIRQRLQWEIYQNDTAKNPTDASPLKKLAERVDTQYISQRLRVLCMEVAQGHVYSSENQSDRELQIIQLAEVEKWKDEPAIAYYLSCYRMLRQPEVEAHFQDFKSLLVESNGQFTADEIRELFTHAVNFCIRRINRGEEKYSHEALELYQSALESGYLTEGRELTRFTYHNIVAAGLQTGALDWVEHFLHEHKKSLARRYRESSFSFNLARLEYTRRNHDAVLELLQKANYRDPLLNLAAKTLLLKTYHDLDEYDLLQSHLDAMRNYIRRKRVIGYHRTNYSNIIKYSERLLRVNFSDKKEVENLKETMINEKVLTERKWLLGRLE